MTHERKPLRSDRDTPAQGKRTEREGIEPQSQPAEFNDDMLVNRDTPPPPPRGDEKKRD